MYEKSNIIGRLKKRYLATGSNRDYEQDFVERHGWVKESVRPRYFVDKLNWSTSSCRRRRRRRRRRRCRRRRCRWRHCRHRTTSQGKPR